MEYKIRAACASDIGNIRSRNEDNLYFDGHIMTADSEGTDDILYQQKKIKDHLDFGIFDGMGGHADGQIASFIAASTFKKACESNSLKPQIFLENIMFDMSEAVWQRAYQDLSNTGTTASVLRMDQEKYYIADVGDSPVFLFRDGQLDQISYSHTDEIYFKNLLGRKRKPALTQYVGVDPDRLIISPFLDEGEVMSGDKFLLCSDGLTDMVSKEELTEMLSRQVDVRIIVQDLIERAKEMGGRDNISVILIEVEESKSQKGKRKKSITSSGEKNGSNSGGKYKTRRERVIGICTVILILIVIWSSLELAETLNPNISIPSVPKMVKTLVDDIRQGDIEVIEVQPDEMDADEIGTDEEKGAVEKESDEMKTNEE